MNVYNLRHELVDLYKMSIGCEICGYKKHPSSLCFDHLPNTNKSEHVKNGYSKRSSAGGMSRLYYKKHNIEQLIDEIKKCRILCSNCHMEITHSKIKRSFKKNLSLPHLEIKLLNKERNKFLLFEN